MGICNSNKLGDHINIFVVYIGGETATSLIEVHDLKIIVAEKIEDTFESIKKTWFGLPNKIHIDCWGKLESVENYNVILKNHPSTDSKKIYFVNLGGYDSKRFTELHENVFVVAESEAEAKAKAKSKVQHWEVPHKDNLCEVEKCININDLIDGKFIHLEPTNSPKEFEFTCKYWPI